MRDGARVEVVQAGEHGRRELGDDLRLVARPQLLAAGPENARMGRVAEFAQERPLVVRAEQDPLFRQAR